MGKAPKLLNYLIDPSIDGPEFDKLREQGHTVHVMGKMHPEMYLDGNDYNSILGPQCWWMPKEHIDLLPLATKAAREVRYANVEPKVKKPRRKKDAD